MQSMNRRHFLKSASAGLVAAQTGLSWAAAEKTQELLPQKVVDTHTHFYDTSRPEGVPWPPKNSSLYRTVLPKDFVALKKYQPVNATVVVEASKLVEDNQWILDVAKDNPVIIGFVGRLTPGDPQFRQQLKRFAKNPIYKGIRVNHNLVEPGLSQPRFIDDLKFMADKGLQVDLNGGPVTLDAARKVAQQVPDLRIVVDHIGNVVIKGDEIDPEWRRYMEALADQKQVFIKVSALVEGASRHRPNNVPADVNYYRPTLDVIWNQIGIDRMIFGSNWPVSERAADYVTLQKILVDYLQDKGQAALDKVFWQNSKVAYRWDKYPGE
ncbi:amidohydrolase family protein [Gimesia benthica]|uniref:Amidohydrolase family protein n=1 Tax=Gimesia benthica TaxID=2608982 RepID=A0A6I6AH23_9PLAN|nr:amidohydrolase family protein [Gimesia benthica]QGQ25396.1 amidohydrolase family protein [Gimesia benthica]